MNKKSLLLIFLLLSLTACQNKMNAPYAPNNKNTVWVCSEIDAFFAVNEKQQCYGEMNCDYGRILFQLVFFDNNGFGSGCFEIYQVDDSQKTDFILAGTSKYYDDRCVLIIEKEGNRLLEMTEETIMLTFYEQSTRLQSETTSAATDNRN